MMKTIASFLFFLFIACIFSVGKSKRLYPNYEWKLPPSIVNCITPEDMDVQVFDDAVKFWEGHGHSFLFKENYSGDICDSPLPHGFIIIKISYDLSYYTLGKTSRVFEKDSYVMAGSIIHLNYAHVHDTLVLTHEIGHALGYMHVDEVGHIMNPLRPNAGFYFY